MSKIANTWSADRMVYLQAIMSSDESKPKTSFQLLNGGAEDYKKVRDLYIRSMVSGYEIGKVEVIYNPILETSFESVVQLLTSQRDDKQPQPKTERKAHADLRAHVSRYLDKELLTYNPADQKVKLLPLFHGTHPSLVESICKTGYRRPANDHVGFQGLGIYHSCLAHLAYEVHGTGVLLLNWIVFRSPFSVISSDIPLEDTSPYDMLFSLVRRVEDMNPHEKAYFPIRQEDLHSEFSEVVVLEPIQILPRYIVRLSPSGLNLVAVAPQLTQADLVKTLMELAENAQDELKDLLEWKIECLKKELNSEVSSLDKWLYTHASEILRLRGTENESFAFLLPSQMEHVLRIYQRSFKPVIVQPPLKEEQNPDFQKGLALMKSEDFGDYPEAFKCFVAAAQKDVDAAYFQLGMCFKTGKGVKKRDDVKAFENFLLAADRGHTESQYLVVQYYKMGLGTPRDFEKAIKYTKLAAKKHHPEALDYLGHCYFHGHTVQQNFSEAFTCFALASTLGNESSSFYLALCYQDGLGVKADPDKAFGIFHLLADLGNRSAQYQAGQCYKLGKGVRQSFLYAVKYSLLAADQGDDKAQDYIGHCYFHGYTLPQDYSQAIKYFRLSAEQKNPSALEYLGICYKDGKGVDQDLHEAAKNFQLAADIGKKESQYLIGCAYKDGKGVQKDLKKAKYYLSLALDQGIKAAKTALEGL